MASQNRAAPISKPAVAVAGRMTEFPVVALGASAGGLDAFRRFLEAAPADSGMAYVLIQHLDPTHESMMAELLAGRTLMPVQQAAEGMAVEPDHVYAMPPGSYLAIADGSLHLSEPRERHGARLPFDFFLHSLAEACGARAVAVILSGTGGDGSLGLRAVHDKGGLVIAQEPKEAAFDGMPRSAIATGCVALVLPVAEIPQALRTHGGPGSPAVVKPADHTGTAPEPEREPEPTTNQLAGIVELLRNRTSHDFSLYKEGTLLRRIERRMTALGIGDGAAYLGALSHNVGEIDLLARDLLINVTQFFRDPAAFETLADAVVTPLVARQPLDRPLRIWVPGSSTGEEAYSLAMLFLETIAANKRPVKLQVFASDVDKDSVACARAGLYPESISAQLSSTRLARFFAREPGGYRVVPNLRDVVVFTVQDVLTDPPFSRLDLVSCRNLLIYLRPEAQRRVLLLFHFALREDGVLFLGGSETVGDLDDRFEPISKPQRIYRHIGRVRPGEIDFPIGGGNGGRAVWSRLPSRPDQRGPELGDVMRAALLESYAPASVLINRKHETLYTLGPTDRYLRVAPGEPSRDLFAMVREGLRTKLRSAIQQANQAHQRVIVMGAQSSHGGKTVTVDIAVLPISSDREPLLLISFIDRPRQDAPPLPPADAAGNQSRVAELERELETTRAELQSAIRNLEIANEEQKSINEEAMSVNEEFQSTNEELETSKEELQSLNEELTALNNQLQETIEQQRQLADDLQNILNSSEVATLFLDHQLNIRFFTPAVKVLFGVIATDIGRPLRDLARHFDDPDLLIDAQAVLTQVSPKKREVLTDSGAWYIREALPYRSHDGQIEGVVITFVNVSEIKAVEHDLQAAHVFSESIIDTIHQPLLVLDPKLQVVSANRSFFRVFGLSPEATVGHPFATGADPSGNLPGLRGFLEQVRASSTPLEDCEIEIDLPPLGHRYLLVNARNIQHRPPEEPRILLAIDDVTERKHATLALEAAKRQAEQANLAKSRFLAAASHDLRQPLQTLSLLQGLLARKVTDEAGVQLAARFDETLGAMSGMLNTLLDINQLEAGIVRAEISCFPINDILERLSTEFGYHAQSRGLSWRVVRSAAVVRSDPRLLEQMIRNLLSNAVKYTSKGGLLLGCRRRGETLCIEVWDTGTGIAGSQLHAIFEEFYQLNNTARERSKGLGLGLAIVKRLADMLGHTVKVRSIPNKGSVFGITVPMVALEGPARRAVPDQPVPAPEVQSGKTIVIVEDDPAMREALELLFDAEHYRIEAVAEGMAALDLISGGVRPDLIIADYNLPGPLNGAQVVERLRETRGYRGHAIILTGDISTATLLDIARQGCRHLSKPVRAAELTRLVHGLLSQFSGPAPADADAQAEATPAPTPAADTPSSTVFVVDDDGAVREAMRVFLESDHRAVETYSSAEAFLEAWHPGRDGCLVVDARMRGISGVELVERLAADGHILPAIIITGFGDVQMAVRAMKAGAADFIEKPVRAEELLAGIDRAMTLTHDHSQVAASKKAAAALVATLTERQRQIMEMVLTGCPSKNIASDLGISQRTVENHRAAIMKKTGSRSLPALARLALGLT